MAGTEIVTLTDVRAVIGSLVRRAAHTRARITITDHGQPAAVLISADELADIEDALAMARLELSRAAGVSGELIPHEDVRRTLGMSP